MGELVATVLPPTELATVAPQVWDAGDAVLPLDPNAPKALNDQIVAALRPTRLHDHDGAQALSGGVPVDDDIVAVVATSGTTGNLEHGWAGKGVELTRRGMEEGARAYCLALGATADDCWLGCLPMHHVAGLAIIPRSRVTGVPLVVHDGFDVQAVARAPATDAATLVLLVPTMLNRLLDAGAPLAEYRWVLVGAGPLPDAARARCVELGVSVRSTYGMTEAWGGVAFDGVAIDGVEIAIDGHGDYDGEREGEILVRGDLVMKRYRLRPDLTAAAFDDDGWYRTGDIGELDADGRLSVTDRRDDIVKSGGVSVSPSAVEHVLEQHPAVADVAVIGRDDPEWGERVVACIVPVEPSAPPTLSTLRAFARDDLPASHLPREVQVVSAIPRSTSGKARRRALRGR